MRHFKLLLAASVAATTLGSAPAVADDRDAIWLFLDTFVSDVRSTVRGEFRQRNDDDDDGWRRGRNDDDDDDRGWRRGRDDDDDDRGSRRSRNDDDDDDGRNDDDD